MALFRKNSSSEEYREKLSQLQQQRSTIESKKRGDNRSESLVGLRLATVLNQLQAIQAIQGLAELTPKDKSAKRRFKFSENRKERAAQRQWLMFKADWLEALLEDAIDEVQALDDYEQQLDAKDRTTSERNTQAE